MGVPVPEGGISPVQEWNRDSRPLTFLDASVVAEAFLHHEERLVDKGACISFRGKKFETRPALIVSYHGMEPFTARPLKIGAFCDKNPSLPVAMQPKETESFRLLNALEKKQVQSMQRRADAISFGSYRKDGGDHV